MRYAWTLALVFACSPDTTSSIGAELGTPTITTSATYSVGSSIGVSWSRLPGNAHDWISIAPVDSDPTTVSRWIYTNGALDGTTSFPAMSRGKYVARAYLDDSYTILAESAFTVTGVSVTVDRAAYLFGAAITVTWDGLPGSSGDFVGISAEGSSPPETIVGYYFGDMPSGSYVFDLSISGRFVARAWGNDNSINILAQSDVFTSGVTLTTTLASYPLGQTIPVEWSLLPGNSLHDWIAIAPQGSPPTTVTTWAYAHGNAAGTHVFWGPPAGTYVARAFSDDSYEMLIESAPFVVGN